MREIPVRKTREPASTTSPPVHPDIRGNTNWTRAPTWQPARESSLQCGGAHDLTHSRPGRKQNPDTCCLQCRTQTRPCREPARWDTGYKSAADIAAHVQRFVREYS